MADTLAITVPSKAFREALSVASLAVPNRTPKEILQFCKLRTDGADLLVETSDQQKSVSVRISGVDATKGGIACLPFSKLKPMVDGLAGETVVVRVNEKQAESDAA